MAKKSKIGAVNKQFLDRIKPELNSWGLSKHPNPASWFGPDDFGYEYDFADTRDDSDMKIVAFYILNPGPTLSIMGLKTSKPENLSKLPIILNNPDGVFILTRRWSILRPLNVRFEFSSKSKSEPVEVAASRLIDSVIKELPKLKSFLYGRD